MMNFAPKSQRNDDLKLMGVHRTFKVEGRDILALSNVSLVCEHGSFTALIGPSGCGKSTLLKIIAGLDHPDQGAVSIGKTVTCEFAYMAPTPTRNPCALNRTAGGARPAFVPRNLLGMGGRVRPQPPGRDGGISR